MQSSYRLDTEEWVILNGARQNIRILTQDTRHPVILFLHGGPGACDRHIILKAQRALSERYTLVMWDQRGSGKSFTPASMKQHVRVQDYIDDARELVELLCTRFCKEKIAIAGHSWGTIIGLPLCASYPEHIGAYIGQGQFINGARNEALSYQFCLNEAKARGDKRTYQKLKSGAPVNGSYPTHRAMMLQRNCLTRYGGGNYAQRGGLVQTLILPLLKTPEYRLRDIPGYVRGLAHLSTTLWDEVVARHYDETIVSLQMPVLLTMGQHDYNTPAVLAREWFDRLEAPSKCWVAFERVAHSPIIESPEAWREAVIRFLDAQTF